MGTMIEQLNPKVRRILALIVDIVFVVAIGAIIGTVFKTFLIKHSKIAYYIGFAIAWLYHGISNAMLKDGQSAGKILVGLKVINKSGKRIGVIRSLLRSFPIVISFFGEPAGIPDFWKEVFTYILTPLWISLAYFAVLYPCCRSTHDFISGTCVADAQSTESGVPVKSIKKEIFIIVLLSCVLLGIRLCLGSAQEDGSQVIKKLKKTHAELTSLNGIEAVSIQIVKRKSIINIITKNNPLKTRSLAEKASCMLLENVSSERLTNEVQVVIMRGFDMRIYRYWDVYEQTLSAYNLSTKCPEIK